MLSSSLKIRFFSALIKRLLQESEKILNLEKNIKVAEDSFFRENGFICSETHKSATSGLQQTFNELTYKLVF